MQTKTKHGGLKRLVSSFLSVIMLLSCISVMNLNVWAGEGGSYNASVEFRASSTPVCSGNVTATDTTHNGSQHGSQVGSATFTNVPQLAKFIIGGCSYSNSNNISITVTDNNSSTKNYTVNNDTASCENGYSPTLEHSQYVIWYLDGETENLTAPITVEFSWNGAYVPYIDAVSVDEIPATTNVTMTVSGLDEVDASVPYIVFKSTDNSDTQVGQITSGQVTVTLKNALTYTPVIYGGNSHYTLSETSATIATTALTAVKSDVATAEFTTYNYDFTYSNTDALSTVGKAVTAYTTSNGLVKITAANGMTNNGQHGLTSSGSMNFAITVAGNSAISFGGCAYANGTIAGAEGTTVTPAEAQSSKTDSDGGLVTFLYSGGAATLNFTVTNTSYIHSLKVISDETLVDYKGKTITVKANATDEELSTGLTFKNVADAVNAISTVTPANESERITINVADGTYTGRFDVTTPYVTLQGTSTAGTIITDSNAVASGTFHGDTVAVKATGFVADKLTIKNTGLADGATAEQDTNNATALSVGYTGAVDATFTDCIIDAPTDPVYTNGSLTMTNCEIKGFQDVICGSGNVVLTNCTWNVGSPNAARFLVPTGTADFKATNLIVTGGGSRNSYLGRPWNDTTATITVDGYNDASGCVPTTNAGFEVANVNSGKVASTALFWISRPTGATNYTTTLSTLSSGANAYQASYAATDSDNYTKVVGLVNSALVADTNVSKVGFAVYKSDGTFNKNMESETVYKAGDDYYTVFFVNGLNGHKVRPYITYNGKNIEGSDDLAAIATSSAS